ncbi:MAG: phosphodiesterase, partial [Paludibacteraceae bacterium]|nr:phosphodiesterase [Paludibacteraceae bacterium]
MKWLIASDIHGSAYYCRKLLNAFEKEGADRILLLGDVLYHGPRNDLPKDYAPKEVISMLNPLSDRILCVRGNCDTEVDQMVLSFPVLAEYALLDAGEKLIFATHGHNFHNEKLPAIKAGDILLHGHTHVPVCEEFDTHVYINPGSVSIPKENSPHSYMTYDGRAFLWKDLESDSLTVY